MAEVYEEFIVFDLENSGERKKLPIKQDELQSHLSPEQVLIIIREDLRRIFIWKGSKSPVRKRFISSKVAQDLQKELLKDPRYHRCKIVSIDQGDELQEFLNAFKLESMQVVERLPDMRYIRNIERDRIKEANRLVKERAPPKGQVDEEEYYSPALEDTSDDVVISSIMMRSPVAKEGTGKMMKPSVVRKAIGLSDIDKEKIMEKILKTDVPENHERQNLILGHKLYAAVSKVADVFGKNIVDIVWEEIKKLPEGVMELDNNVFRVYFDQKKSMVEAVEVLKKQKSPNDENNKNTNSASRRQLPKIPSKE